MFHSGQISNYKKQRNKCEDPTGLARSSICRSPKDTKQVELSSQESSELSLRERARKRLKFPAENLSGKYLSI